MEKMDNNRNNFEAEST